MDQPPHTRALPQSPLFRARCALSTVFFITGVVFRPLRVLDETAGTPAQIGVIEYRGVAESGSEEALS